MQENPRYKDWKQLLRRDFGPGEYLVIAVNLIPIFGVCFWGWNAKEMFLVYCLESVIAGLYTIMQMLLTTWSRKRDVWDEKSNTIVSGYFFILFFIFHFGLFVFVQMGIFLGVAKYPGLEDEFISVGRLVFNFPRYLSDEAMFVLIAFVFSYGAGVIRKFLWTGDFRQARLFVLMFTPYPRIFVQQFVVILGSFFLMFGAASSIIFMVIFAVVKVFFELMFDYEKIIGSMRKPVDVAKDQ